nr:rod shape-determining protein [Caproicibacter fermentans]
MLGTDLAIDLGTSTTKIYLDGKGIILNEPSAAAVNVETGEVVATGKEAYTMIGRTSDKINVCLPLEGG